MAGILSSQQEQLITMSNIAVNIFKVVVKITVQYLNIVSLFLYTTSIKT